MPRSEKPKRKYDPNREKSTVKQTQVAVAQPTLWEKAKERFVFKAIDIIVPVLIGCAVLWIAYLLGFDVSTLLSIISAIK